MIRHTLFFLAIATMASIAVAQESESSTDALFKEILSEAIPRNQQQDARTTPKLPATNQRQATPNSNQFQPSVSSRAIPRSQPVQPRVSPQDWGTVQKPFRAPTHANTPKLPARQTASQPNSVDRSSLAAQDAKKIIRSVSGSVAMDLIAPPNINLNQKATVRVQLKNIGQNALSNIKLITTLPKHVRFEAARPQPTKTADGRLEFDAIRLAGRSQSFIEIDVVPTAKAPMNIGTQIQYANDNQIAIDVRQPALELNIAGPDEMILGDSKQYLITVTNRGDGVASNLRFTSQFPEGLQKIRSSNTVIPELAPGKSTEIRVTAQGLASGSKEVQFQLASTELELISRKAPVVILQPELEVAATGPSVNFLNRDGIYRIEIANPGKVNCTNVGIDLAVPAEMNVSTISREASYNEATRQLTWTFDSIPAGKTEVIQLKAQCIAEGQHSCGIIVRSNQTIAKEFRLNTTVATRADVSINLSNSSGPVQIGVPADFVINVENRGSKSAKDVEITVALPVALAPAVSEDYTVNQYDNTIKFASSMIRSGEKKTFRFSAVGSAQGEHVVRSQLNLSGSERKIIVEDSVYVYEAEKARVGQKLEPQIRRR